MARDDDLGVGDWIWVMWVVKVAYSLYSAVHISDIEPRDFLRLCMQADGHADGVETCLHARGGRR